MAVVQFLRQRNVLKHKISNVGLNDLIWERNEDGERRRRKDSKMGKAKRRMEGKLWRR